MVKTMSKPWQSPHIKPFQRLQVADGLLMNAERWRLAHDYHRARQNVHFQSLNQPGIVCDLGVCPIAPPSDVPAKYRDGRWVQIQPGIAIDVFGNLIVIPEPVDFRISSPVGDGEPTQIYLVVSYVDPDKLKARHDGELVVTETFRIDEKTTPPEDWEVEVCRIVLEPGDIHLQRSRQVFAPEPNSLDLRYRLPVQARPRAIVRLGIVGDSGDDLPNTVSRLSFLLRSLDGLYPAFQGTDEIGVFSGIRPDALDTWNQYDALYVGDRLFHNAEPHQLEPLKAYIERGGTLWLEITTDLGKIEQLRLVRAELKDALSHLETSPDTTPLPSRQAEVAEYQKIHYELNDELTAVEAELDLLIRDRTAKVNQFAQSLGTPLEFLDARERDHPLRTEPFLFAALPTVQGEAIQLLTAPGLVVAIGQLSSGWGLDDRLSLPRETIRSAQEMGINLLHAASKRRHLIQLQHPSNPESPPQPPLPPPTPSEEPPAEPKKKGSRLPKNILDKLG
jgi:hypothetical protein